MNWIKKIISWFSLSNRYKHTIAGALVLMCFLSIGSILQMSYWISLIYSSLTVLACMLTAEYKDKLNAGPFDLEDIGAGMIIPCLVWIFSLLLLIF